MEESPTRRNRHPPAQSSSAFVPDPSGAGGWICQHCQGLPTHLRVAGWYFRGGADPPSADYVRRHLSMCTGFASAAAASGGGVGGGSQYRGRPPPQQQGQGQGPPMPFPHQSPPPPSWPPSGAGEPQHRRFGGTGGPSGAPSSRGHRSPYDPSSAAGAGHHYDDFAPPSHYPGQQDPWARPPTTPSGAFPHSHLRGVPPPKSAAQASLPPGTSPYDIQQQQMLLHQMQLQQQSYALEMQERQRRMMAEQAMVPPYPTEQQTTQSPGESSSWAGAGPRGQERGGGGAPPPPPRGQPHPQQARDAAGDDPSLGIIYPSGDAAAAFLEDLSKRDNLEGASDAAVLPGDRLLLTDYFYYLNQQLRLCRFTEADRKTRGGKREKTPLGYGGLECRHCAAAAGQPFPSTSPTKPNSPATSRARKFFWSDVDRLANSFAEISGHVLKCRRCPDDVRAALRQLKMRHPAQISRLPRGSQKVFFRRMWRRMHATDAAAQEGDKEEKRPGSPKEAERGGGGDDDDDAVAAPSSPGADDEGPAEGPATPPRALTSPDGRILLAIPEDGQWLSDLDCFVRRSLEVFCATREDSTANKAEHGYAVAVGQVGIRCVYCAASPEGAKGPAVSYPYSLNGVHETVREIERLHLDRCPNLPADDRGKLRRLQTAASLSSVLRRYYVVAARAIGLVETTNEGLRVEGGARRLGRNAAGSPFDPASLRTEGEEEGAGGATAGKTSPGKRKEVPETKTGDEESDPVSKKSSV